MPRTLVAGTPATGAHALQWLARIGFVVKGGLSVVVGVLALQVAARAGGRVTGTRGALVTVLELRREAGSWAAAVSRFGVAARAIVLALLGWGAVAAGWFRDPSAVNTTASSLRALAQPGDLGRFLLAVTAAGFIAYGFYQFVHARYLRMRL
jgi:hypothetical protein